MPFEHPIPRPFTSTAIRAYAPIFSGVYGISNAREWVYIGKANNIQHVLLALLDDIRTPLMRRAPTGFVFEICDEEARCVARQNRLVLEYEPICNRWSR